MTEIHSAIRAELDQTPEWWDRQYQSLVKKRIPRDMASHEGHNVEVVNVQTYGSITVKNYATCTDCGVSLNDWEGTE